MIIRAAQLQQTPWKNGRGVTTEIARRGEEDYLWRISFAEIMVDSAFSEFPGYERLLVIWEGDGIILGGATLKPFSPYQFSGDIARDSKLINGPVKDLGVIYKLNKFEIKMTMVEKTTMDSLPFVGDGTATDHFLFIVQGRLKLGDDVLGPRDTIRSTQNIRPIIHQCQVLTTSIKGILITITPSLRQ